MTRWQRVIQCDDDKIGSVETMRFNSFGDDLDITDSDQSQDEPAVPNAEEQASILLQQAQIEAENIILNAQSEADEIRNKAFQSGYEEGQAKSIEELKETADKLTRLFTNTMNEIAIIKDEIIGNAENDIIELTLAVAEKLVCCELKQHPDFIVEVIKEAIKTAKSGNKIALKVNPDDREILEKNADELIELTRSVTFSPNMRLIIEDDENLVQGDCVVVTDVNIFDMTYKSRLDSIIETINLHRSQVEIGETV